MNRLFRVFLDTANPKIVCHRVTTTDLPKSRRMAQTKTKTFKNSWSRIYQRKWKSGSPKAAWPRLQLQTTMFSESA